MKLDAIVVNSLSVIKTTTDPRWYNVAARDHHSLSYRIKGENLIFDGDAEIVSNAHTLTFVPANKAYSHKIVTPSQQIAILFTTQGDIGDAVENFTLPLRCKIESLFFSLYNQWELAQRKKDLYCMAVFYNILAEIEKNINPEDSLQEGLLKKTVVYMHEHYRDSDFNMEKLYQQIYISPAYFRRIFKKVYRISPVEYLKTLRINYAKQLLENGYHTIYEIAELSGFATPAYFSYEFKRMTGVSPSQYRL